jgi:diguanylate cyclase (GGDEF)-like protein/PAS domain S-box-containing protein
VLTKPQSDQYELYRVLAEKSFAGIYVVQNGRFRYLNKNAASYVGYAPEELVGQPPIGIVHPEDRENVEKNARVMLSGKKTSPSEFRILTKDGHLRWIMETVVPIEWEGKPAILGNSMDITERKNIEEALHERQERFRILFEGAHDAIFMMEDYRYTDCNQKTLEMFQCKREEIIGQTPARFSTPLQPDGRISIQKAIEKMNAALMGEPHIFEWRHCRYDGTPFETEVSLNRLEISGRRLLQAIVRDVSHRKRAEEDLKQSEERYRTIIENIGDGYYEVDLKGNILFLNDAALRITGIALGELQGANFATFANQADAAMIFGFFHQVYLTGKSLRGVSWRAQRPDGREQHLEVSVSLIRNAAGRPAGFRGILHDVTERRRREEAIQHMAYHDALTGLPNRLLLYDRFAQVLAHARRNEEQFAVAMMDLDKFKEVNDRLGHDAGDRLLCSIGARLSTSIREGDTVARFGGDEFLLLAPYLKQIEDLESLGQKILQVFQQPFDICGEALYISASVGFAVFPQDGPDREALFQKADINMYRAKSAGGNCWMR